jgi:hypothetical protein
LAFCGRHPDRVIAATVLVGITPLRPDEIDRMIGFNQATWQLAVKGDRTALEALLEPVRRDMLADPLASFRTMMATAPEDDHRVMNDPSWQAAFTRSAREALAQGVQGWADEMEAITTRWDDIDLGAVRTSLTWYHAAADRSCPLTAAERLLAELPDARLVRWPDDVGHLHGYHLEGELLDELLQRG